MNAASHIHGTMHAKVFKEMLTLVDHIDEWSLDEDVPHAEDEKNYLRPDIVGWCKGSIALVIEICLSTTAKDYGSAKFFYQECGIPEYFIVDINKKLVTRFVLENKLYKVVASQISKELQAKIFGDTARS